MMKNVEFRQRNMYCNACISNVINAILKIRGVSEFEVDMKSKIIRLQLYSEAPGRKKIQAMINAAITKGTTYDFVAAH